MSATEEIQRFTALSLAELRNEWRERLHGAPPAYQSRALLLHALCYQIQARQFGPLATPTRKRLRKLATEFAADPRYVSAAPEALRPGAVLLRDWNGKRYGVTVTEDGFLFEGATYSSLSQVAKAITGTARSGPLFFKLTNSKESSP